MTGHTAHHEEADWVWQEFVKGGSYQEGMDTRLPTYRPNTFVGDYGLLRRRELDEAKGRVARIDLEEMQDGSGVVLKSEWESGWLPGHRPKRIQPIAAGWTLGRAADHLERSGWTVRRWPGGARAWRCGARAVRSQQFIERRKQQLAGRPEFAGMLHTLNLALDT